ncbi:hypothetical protein ACFV23_48960, partial [Streptomyces sp. NPDC059627]
GPPINDTGHSSYLEPLAAAITQADRRGVRVDVLCFGEPPFVLESGGVIRHSSTDGTVYRHHQARHLAITCDMGASLWALAPEGDDWEAVFSPDDALLTALVKGFIRHDIFMQRTYHDFAGEMRDRYGAGLEGLFDWQDRTPGTRPAEPASEPGTETDRDGLRRLA